MANRYINLPNGGFIVDPDDTGDMTWWFDDSREGSRIHTIITRCECGTAIIMKREDHPQFHSDYCPVYKAWYESNKNKRS